MNIQTRLASFLDLLASNLDYDRATLGLIATQQSGGPTVRPGADSAGGTVSKKVEVFGDLADCSKLPNLWYDTLRTEHVDFQIVSKAEKGKVSIPTPIYAWQHHVMPGNCQICVNRWARILDKESKWTDDMRLAGLKLRATFATESAHTITMLVTTGASFSGAEVHSQFEKLYGNSTHSVFAMDLKKFLAGK